MLFHLVPGNNDTLAKIQGFSARKIPSAEIPKMKNVSFCVNKHYSKLLNESTGTLKKYPPKIQAVRTFFAVLLQLSQVNAVPEN